MSGFLPREPTTFINIKLTDAGRRLLSLGRLTFDKAGLSDREINYSIDRTGVYNIENNRVIAPKDNHPPFINMDGSDYLELQGQNVLSVKQIASATTVAAGFFTGETNAYGIDQDRYISQVTIDYSTSSPSGGTSIGYATATPAPQNGQLIYIPWKTVQNSGTTNPSGTDLDPNNPTNNLWYRIVSADTSGQNLILDRPTPDFGGAATPQVITAYTYPFNGVETYYGSATTVNTRVWNMNVIRTSSELGTDASISGYTTYGSLEYNGFKTYAGFSSDTRAIGVIHYTNEYIGNTYAEQLVEGTVELEIPNIMWHRYPSNVGEAISHGITLYDVQGGSIFDNAAQTTYKLLRDGVSSTNQVVGRVYHKLKMIVITDPELLTALTYKANRSFTLPPLNLSLSSVPKFPLNISDATGLAATGKTYFVTYIVESDTTYQSGVTFGHPQSLPCGYISRIDGETDAQGNHQYISATFPSVSFPYMRNSGNMDSSSAFSGSGWNANKIQILVNEVDNTSSGELFFDTVPSDSWRRISSGGIGNGVYTGSTTDLTIDPLKLVGNQFVISREDYTSGSTYVMDSVFHQNNDISLSGLTFGSESFFFGKLSANVSATSFKTSIVVLADNTTFNGSNNSTFEPIIDENTYITEIGIFNLDNELVAIGKPTFPIKKSNGRFLGFKLEIDF